MDSWERLREAAAAVLLRLPSPLPGTGTPAELQPLLLRALRLLGCPRGREADAGAQLVVLLLRKYGGGWAATSSRGSGRNGCAWLLDLAAGTVQAPGQQTEPADEQQADGRKGQQVAGDEERQAEALWCFLSSGCRLLEQRVQLAREDMLGACRWAQKMRETSIARRGNCMMWPIACCAPLHANLHCMRQPAP